MSAIPQKVFWVGSVRNWPAPKVAEVLYDAFPGQLLTLPHGEHARLETWAMETLRRTQEEVSGHVVTVPGDSETYNSLRRVSYVGEGSPDIKPGLLPVLAEAGELRAAIRLLQDKMGPGVELPPGHLGSIDPAAWAEYTYATHDEAVRHLPAYRKAYVQAMNRACGRDNIAAQIESPYALVSVLTAPKKNRRRVAEERAAEIAETVAKLQVPVRIHPCYGDFNRRSWLDAIDLEGLVLLVNAIHDKCGDKVLSYLLPMAAGNIMPSVRREFYAPLADLNPAVRGVVGCIRPDVNDDVNFKALTLAAEVLRCHVVAFGLPCGAGRLTDRGFRRTILVLQECLRRLQSG